MDRGPRRAALALCKPEGNVTWRASCHFFALRFPKTFDFEFTMAS